MPLCVNLGAQVDSGLDRVLVEGELRTSALIVFAHPYCARHSRRDVVPRHTLTARAVGEM